MRVTTSTRCAFVALVFLSSFSARANFIGISADPAGSGQPGDQLTLGVYYDFTDFSMLGGGANLVYDSTVLEFVNYTRGPLAADVDAPASPIGQLEYPGLYAGFGIGQLNPFFNGINSAGNIGEFVFNIIGDSTTADFAGCGGNNPQGSHQFEGLVCVTPNAINPFRNLASDVVDEEIFTGPGAYIPPANPVPVPAALWLFISTVGVMAGIRVKF